MPVPDARMEFLIDGAWVDVTDDVRAAGTDITHARGYREGGTRVDPAEATFTVASPGGRYSNRNPRSPYFGKLGRNTPARCTVAGPTYLKLVGNLFGGTGLRTPHVTSLGITGDLDVRIDAALTNWNAAGTVELVGKGSLIGDQRSWFLHMRDQALRLEWSPTGTVTTLAAASTVPVPVISGNRLAIRATLDVDNGSGGHTVTFYTAPTLAGPWTQLGDAVPGSGTTSIFNTTSEPLIIGDGWTNLGFPRADGKVHAVELRDGIDGTVVADPDFTLVTPDVTTFTDAAGREWHTDFTAYASITDRWDRFSLAVPEWPPSWHVSGNNVTAGLTAAGTLRRLGQGQKALGSTLRRRIPSDPSLLGYWPLEDGANATSVSSGLPDGGPPMAVSGFDFGAATSLAGSSPLPVLDSSSGELPTFIASVPADTSGSNEWMVEFVYLRKSPDAGMWTHLRVLTSGTFREWYLQMSSAGGRLICRDKDGADTTLSDFPWGTTLPFEDWYRIRLTARQNGSNVDWRWAWVRVAASTISKSGSFAGTVGGVKGVASPPAGFSSQLDGMAIGHIAVLSDADSTIFNYADHGYDGEVAGDRVARLSGEEGQSITVAGIPDTQQLMGPQGPATLLELLEECEATDGGILYEDRESSGLWYRDRASLYNQEPKLVIPYGRLAPPLTPVDDDQTIRNDITRERIGGSSARVVVEDGPLSVLPPEQGGVGIYDESRALSMHDDTQPLQLAAWAAHLGTWDEARYPAVRILLHKYPALIPDVLALDVGDTIRVTDLPDFLPPGPLDLMVMGYREEIGPRTWGITLHCAPAGPWTVAVVGTARGDTAGSELTAAVDSDDTSVQITTTVGSGWTADPFDSPFDIRVGGEVMTVTSPGILVNQANPFFDTDVAGWTSESAALSWSTTVVHPDQHAHGSLLITPAGGGATFASAVGDLTGPGSITPSTDYVMSAWVYSPNGWSDTRPSIYWYTDAGSFISTSASGAMAVSAGTWTFLRATFTAPASAGQGKARIRHGATPTASDVLYVWAARITPVEDGTSPQTMTVVRSRNGVVKSHAAGTAVRLAHPSYVAL